MEGIFLLFSRLFGFFRRREMGGKKIWKIELLMGNYFQSFRLYRKEYVYFKRDPNNDI